MKNIANIILAILTAISVYVIIYVGLGIGWSIGTSDNYERINKVLETLSYSYLAGCIFYILTSTVPNYYKRRKLKPTIQSKLKLILGKLEESKKQAFPLEDYNKTHTNEEYIERMRNTPLSSMCALEPLVYHGVTVGAIMKHLKEAAMIEISDVLRYQEYMTEEQVIVVASLTNSAYFYILKAIGTPKFDQPDNRVKIAEDLLVEIAKIKSIIENDK